MLPPLFRSLGRGLQWKLHLLERNALARVHPLRYLFLEVTRRCNLACTYCGSECAKKTGPDELSAAEWIEVVRQVAADFDPTTVMVAVMGGEPLMLSGIVELFAELGRLKFPFGMVSNGQLVTAELARQIVATGMRSISISLDAPEELNDQLRGRGSFRRASEALGHFQQAGFTGNLEVMSTLTRPAVARLSETRAVVAALRVPLWRIVPVMPIGRAAERPELVPGPPELRAMLQFVREARRDGQAPVPEFCEEGYLDEFEGEVRPFLNQCLAGITIAGIRSDGRIGACPELGDGFLQGNIRRERFRDVWESRYQLLRDRSWSHKGDCESCEALGKCQGPSLHLLPSPEGPMLRCFHLMLKDAPAGVS